MATPEAERELVTDAEIAQILEQNNAGVGTLMATYASAEQAYFNAVSPDIDTTYLTTTSTAQ